MILSLLWPCCRGYFLEIKFIYGNTLGCDACFHVWQLSINVSRAFTIRTRVFGRRRALERRCGLLLILTDTINGHAAVSKSIIMWVLIIVYLYCCVHDETLWRFIVWGNGCNLASCLNFTRFRKSMSFFKLSLFNVGVLNHWVNQSLIPLWQE